MYNAPVGFLPLHPTVNEPTCSALQKSMIRL